MSNSPAHPLTAEQFDKLVDLIDATIHRELATHINQNTAIKSSALRTYEERKKLAKAALVGEA